MSELEGLSSEIAACVACDLCKNRTRAVPGEGPQNADILFVGEGPGFHEDQQGRPFVGPAGRFLEELLASIGLVREEVFITNVVKCRPPGNRDPMPAEIDACRTHLERQIQALKPRVIVTLGRYSLAWFSPKDSISKVHGQIRNRDGRLLVHMYHPAAALHSGNLRKTIEEDFKKVREALERSTETTAAAIEETPASEQMRLF